MADNPSPLDRKPYRATVLGLLSGHWGILLLGLVAVGAETGAALLEPWPIKIVLDTVLRAKPLPQWLERAIASMLGTNALGVLEFAVAMVLLIAIVGGVGSYAEKQSVTTLGQRVTHELRSRIYTHAQRLSMSFHDKKRTGDIISTATADVDAIQSAITSGVLDTLYYALVLIGMSWPHALSRLALHAHRAGRPAGTRRRRLHAHAADQAHLTRGARPGGGPHVDDARGAVVDAARESVRPGRSRARPVRVPERADRRVDAPGARRQGKAGAGRRDHRRRGGRVGPLVRRASRPRRPVDRRRARRLPAVLEQDVQADSRAVEDDRHVLARAGGVRTDQQLPRRRARGSRSARSAARASLSRSRSSSIT